MKKKINEKKNKENVEKFSFLFEKKIFLRKKKWKKMFFSILNQKNLIQACKPPAVSPFVWQRQTHTGGNTILLYNPSIGRPRIEGIRQLFMHFHQRNSLTSRTYPRRIRSLDYLITKLTL